MNVAPDQANILGVKIFLDHRLLSSIYQKILTITNLPDQTYQTYQTKPAKPCLPNQTKPN